MLWQRLKDNDYGARELLGLMGLVVPPVDPFEVARSLDVRVKRLHGDDVMGAVSSTPTATIWVNTQLTPTLQRLVVAHELGHLLLHPTGQSYIDRTLDGAEEESEANAFAMDLLLPRGMLALYSLPSIPLSRTAELFGVSTELLRRRVRDLGWDH